MLTNDRGHLFLQAVFCRAENDFLSSRSRQRRESVPPWSERDFGRLLCKEQDASESTFGAALSRAKARFVNNGST